MNERTNERTNGEGVRGLGCFVTKLSRCGFSILTVANVFELKRKAHEFVSSERANLTLFG